MLGVDMRPRLFLLSIAVALAGACAHSAPANLKGHYTSDDDYGVLVFREDGTFGFKFAVIFDFYSEDNLPPNKGRYRIVDGRRVELFDLPPATPKFSIEVFDGGQTLILIRTEADGTLPERALYRKKK